MNCNDFSKCPKVYKKFADMHIKDVKPNGDSHNMDFNFINIGNKKVEQQTEIINYEMLLSSNSNSSIFDEVNKTDCSNLEDNLVDLSNENPTQSPKFIRSSPKNNNIMQIAFNIYNNLPSWSLSKVNYYKKNQMLNKLPDAIKKINKDNVIAVIKYCHHKSEDDEGCLITDILKEESLPVAVRIKYAKYIFYQLTEYYKERGIDVFDIQERFDKAIAQKNILTPIKIDKLISQLEQRYMASMVGKGPFAIRNPIKSLELMPKNTPPNGKIDKSFKQNKVGDCWLLAAIKAISATPNGRKTLNDSLKVDKDGNVTVTLKGVNKTYKISARELRAHEEYAVGDLDVRALEIAVNKYFSEKGMVNGRVDIVGNEMDIAYKILTGKKGQIYTGKISDTQINGFNKSNRVVSVATFSNKASIQAENSGSGILIDYHAYIVLKSDRNYVYLVNPWDSGNKFRVDRNTFKDYFDTFYEVDL